ncbi:MAG TPA: DUF4157 domain-containing protein [Herpetosiphonaceae bacterium]
MSTRAQPQQSKAPPSFTPARIGRLQRKCACGGSPGPDGECAACRKQRLERQASSQTTPATAPPIVEDALRSAGQPLDAATRAFMEPRFGHDFGKVRVHTGSQADESAHAVSALAYTVGRDIVFRADQYQPASRSGQRLLAHELAHVVQQGFGSGAIQAKLAISHPGDAYEHEADRVADRIMRMPDPAPRLQAKCACGAHSAAGGECAECRQNRELGVQRVADDHAQDSPLALSHSPYGLFRNGGGQQQPPPPPQPVAPVAPNQNQAQTIENARRAAAIRTQVALMRITGTVAPGPPRTDPGEDMRRRARNLARVMFEWDNPNMEQVEEIVSSMVTRLMNPQVMVAGPKDPECGTRAAYVRGLRPPIILCPTFFGSSAEQQIRTMIHEAAHLARIGSGALGESYCVIFDCQTSCGGFDSADSWAQFVHCLSGQTPDQPPVIQGQPGGAGQQPGSGGRP